MNPHDPQQLHARLLQDLIPQCRWREGDAGLWQAQAREKLKSLLGLDQIPASQASPHILWTHEEKDFTEIRLSLETEPGYRSLMHLLLPRNTPAPPPAILCLQGHATGMHISLGRPLYPEDAEDIAGDRDYALQAVARGFAALTVEQRAFGECGGAGEQGPQCRLPASTALLLGRTLIGERVHDIMRAVDLLRSGRFPVDGSRIAITGNSGGGTSSIYAAAVDERLAAAMPCCAFTSFYASIGISAHCFCNYIPGIARFFDMGDLCALIAPRPLAVISAAQDPSFPLREAREQFQVTQRLYARLEAADRCRLIPAPGGHRYYADLAWPAFRELTGW